MSESDGKTRMLSGVLDADCFALLLGVPRGDIVSTCGELIDKYDFHYDVIRAEELEATILKVLKAIDSGNFKLSGKERQNDWEKGWQENLDVFVASKYDISTLVPKYISKYDVSRLFSMYVKPHDRMFELNFYTVFRHYLFSTYYEPYQNIFEFGCGTGYNLALMNLLFPHKRFVGLDWAESSVKIANLLGTSHDLLISGRFFDYFHPDYSLDIPSNSLIITLNSLEQLGSNYSAFLDFIMEKKPALCINSEPIPEMYDDNDLIDYLAIKYHKARNYLTGYYSALKRLESDGKIRIIKAQRVPIGNLFHEGFSLIIWDIIQ